MSSFPPLHLYLQHEYAPRRKESKGTNGGFLLLPTLPPGCPIPPHQNPSPLTLNPIPWLLNHRPLPRNPTSHQHIAQYSLFIRILRGYSCLAVGSKVTRCTAITPIPSSVPECRGALLKPPPTAGNQYGPVTPALPPRPFAILYLYRTLALHSHICSHTGMLG